MSELIDAFSLDGVTKAPAMFSYDKLDSINKYYISLLPKEVLSDNILNNITDNVSKFISNTTPDIADKIIHTIIKERIHKWSDVPKICNTDLSWLIEITNLDTSKIIWKKSSPDKTIKHLSNIIDILQDIPENTWTEESIKEAVWPYAESEGRGDVLWPTRYSLTGSERSPDPFTVAYILGKSQTISRLTIAKDLLID
jgi:glutamyl/glutaminyl-tRNA synthetase